MKAHSGHVPYVPLNRVELLSYDVPGRCVDDFMFKDFVTEFNLKDLFYINA